jgi:2-polyprenyl-3-methyl-5-hydroxy-6-metoxy-1,4-benzoquinol methylase
MSRCPLCQKDDSTTLYSVKDIPLFQNKVYESALEAKRAQTGTVELTACMNCGFIYNSLFDSRLMAYDPTYQNEQNYSGYFQSYLNEIIKLLCIEGLTRGKIVEIGSGKGYFLELMIQSGLDITGFDPAYEGENPRIIKDYFSPQHSGIQADVIILRHTLEHIFNPWDFLHLIAEINKYQGKIFIEVPSFEWIIDKKTFWDIFYEHCNYFRKSVLKAMFKRSKTGLLFNGQYLYIIAELKDLKDCITENRSNLDGIERILKDELSKYTTIMTQTGPNIVWGAGAKGSTFVNILAPRQKLIKYIVDINPKKQHKYLAKSAHYIYAPQQVFNEAIGAVG